MQNKNKKRKRMYAQFMFSRVKKKFYEILKRMEINWNTQHRKNSPTKKYSSNIILMEGSKGCLN